MRGKQVFTRSVDQVIQAQTFTQIFDKGRRLTDLERADLNKKVQSVKKESGREGWEVWHLLHRNFGVNSVEEMLIEHLAPANTILELLVAQSESEKQLWVKYEELRSENDSLHKSLKNARQNLEWAASKRPDKARKGSMIALAALLLGGLVGSAGATVFFMAPW